MELKRISSPFAERVHPPTTGHQIDGFGGAPGPHQLGRIRRSDKLRQLYPCVFESDGGSTAQLVDAAVHVGVVAARSTP